MGQRILLVEDDDEAREVLRLALEAEGYHVDVAGNGAAALNCLQTELRPGLILADLMMPDVDGWDFLRFLAADERFAAIPVVLITGWFGDLPPGYPVLKKPFDLPEVLAIIRKYVGVPASPAPRPGP